MRLSRLIMGMPITVEILDSGVTNADFERVFAYFEAVDERFSTYKATSEITRINRGEIAPHEYSMEMRVILALSEATKRETGGYFDIAHDGLLDPSGIVKGWAIQQAAHRLAAADWRDFSIDAGGDVQVAGNHGDRPWRVGIRNPFDREENVKVLEIADRGVATSGTAIRGQHIYDPHRPGMPLRDVLSLTVIGPSVYDADRYATAAFAMGRRGISFIESINGFEGYQIDSGGRATFTGGFERYVIDT